MLEKAQKLVLKLVSYCMTKERVGDGRLVGDLILLPSLQCYVNRAFFFSPDVLTNYYMVIIWYRIFLKEKHNALYKKLGPEIIIFFFSILKC